MQNSKTITGSNLQITRALFTKDWRVFRVPMQAMLISGVVCYGLSFVATWFFMPDRSTPAQMHRYLLESIDSGAGFSVVLAILISAAFGGIAIAGERAERSADFIGLLPVTRAQIVISKWLTSICMLGICFVFHGTVAVIILRISSTSHDMVHVLEMFAGQTICAFGVAWLFGSFTRSGPISACLGIAAGAIVTLVSAVSVLDHTAAFAGETRIAIATTLVGMCSLFAGTEIYLRRVAP